MNHVYCYRFCVMVYYVLYVLLRYSPFCSLMIFMHVYLPHNNGEINDDNDEMVRYALC